MNCKLCEREMEQLTLHHLMPRQATKRKKAEPGPTIAICLACHRQIHNLFSNKDLADNFNLVEKLRNHPDMQRFLTWVSKQDPGKRVKVHRQG